MLCPNPFFDYIDGTHYVALEVHIVPYKGVYAIRVRELYLLIAIYRECTCMHEGL